MVSSHIDTYRKLKMARNIAFCSIRSMLEYAYDIASSKHRTWVVVEQAFVHFEAIGVVGFMAVVNDDVFYTPYSPDIHDYDVVQACKTSMDKPEKVICHQLAFQYQTRKDLIKTENSSKERVVETLLQSMFMRQDNVKQNGIW